MKAPRAPKVGTTAYRIVPTALYHGGITRCLHCERQFTLDAAAVAMTAGTEVVGYICPACLAPDARARLLAVLRAEADR